jgi:RHS repeat-associated protein
LQNNHQRWYDAVLAHWQSEDPIAFAVGDANLYRYCGNDSVNCKRPTWA